MKGMQKISRGSGFAGVIAYAFDGDLDKPRELEGEVIGGNMSGRDPQSLTREFNASKAVRPDVEKPVWHNSLRLPEGDKLSTEQWAEIGDAYMKKMGFSENHQRAYILHDDKSGQHIHIVASRIGLDGKLFLGKNENLISTKKIAELEKEFNLTITKGANYDSAGKVVMPDVSRPRKGEVGKFERTGEAPGRFALAKLIDTAIADKPSASVFAERLSLSGVEVRANFSKDTLNGFSFAIDGVAFKGSQLGKQYTGKALFERGLSYEQDRDHAFLRELSSAATRDSARDGAAQAPGNPESSRDRAGDAPGAADSRDLRGAGRGADRRGDRAPAADHSAGAGRVGSVGNDPVSAEQQTSPAEKGSAEVRAEATPEANAERPGELGYAVAPAQSGGVQHADVGGGVGTGVEVSSAGLITTGDKGTDELLQAAHSGRLKAEREVLSRQKKQHAEDMANAKKRQIELDKPASNRLSQLADRSMDSTWRAKEIQAFARATGAGKFEITCSSPNPQEKPIKKVFTAAQLQNPATIKSMASMSARRFDVSIRPDPAAGVLLVKDLDADGIKKLEAVGLQPAAVIDVAGKKQAWIVTGSTLSEGERKALTQRLETLTGVEQKHGGAGGLVGFSSGQKTVSLATCPGQVAPAAGDLVAEIKVAVFEAKAAQQLAKLVDKNAVLRPDRDIDTVGTIKSLRSSWMRDKVAAVRDEAQMWGKTHDPAQIERAVVGAMARQKVPAMQAFDAVLKESAVSRGDVQHAAQVVAQEYTRQALAKEGKPEVDPDAEAKKRYPDLYKRAESGIDAELKAMREQSHREAQAEQQRLDVVSEQKQQELERRRAEERLESDRDRSPTLAH